MSIGWIHWPSWRKPSAIKAASARFLWSVAIPTATSILILRYLVPSPMEGRSGGPVAFVGRVADEHPLAVAVGLFLAVSAVVGYWRGRAARHVTPPSAATAAGFSPGLSLRSTVRLVLMLAFAVIAALALREGVVGTYRVVSGSMIPTLGVGDRVLVDKLAYGIRVPFTNRRLRARAPHRGDVVVMSGGETLDFEKLPTESVIKRVVGLPGDRVSFEADRLVVNGSWIPICDAGPYAGATGNKVVRGRLVVEFLGDTTYATVRPVGSQKFPTFTVPPDQVFVLGDDRVDSSDSRMWNGGRGRGVAMSAIQGRVTRIIGGTRNGDGRLDFKKLVTPLQPQVRQYGVDAATANDWIGDCLKKNPGTPVPAPKS